MTSLQAQQPGTPAPQPGRLSRPYWDGCLVGELRFQRCDICGTIPARPSAICPHCFSRALSWHRSAGHGSLYSWTIVWRPQHPSFHVPYAPAIIELDEGAFLMSAMIGCDDTDLTVGMRVEVEFHPASDTISLPYFRPSGVGAADGGTAVGTADVGTADVGTADVGTADVGTADIGGGARGGMSA